MSYQIKIPSCIFGGAGSIENVKAVIEKENAKKSNNFLLIKAFAQQDF